MQAERPALFLDRDGTIIEEVNYLSRIDQVALIPGTAAALRRVTEAGVPIVVVTNQAGVARGFFDEARVDEVHAHLAGLLADEGVRVEAFRYCPHHASEGIGRYRVDCACRKPKPGMLLAAAAELRLDLARSWMIGDKICDLRAGAAAGCRTVLVRTGHGRKITQELDTIALNLMGDTADITEAIDLWCRRREETQPTPSALARVA